MANSDFELKLVVSMFDRTVSVLTKVPVGVS
jgi:hypothetical protein